MMKKLLFHAIGISMCLVTGLLATEVILRVRDEAGVEGAWNSLFAREVPTTRGTDTSEIVADPILGFKYNPALPEVNSLGIREDEIPLEKTARHTQDYCYRGLGLGDVRLGMVPRERLRPVSWPRSRRTGGSD